jgi:MFS family permease
VALGLVLQMLIAALLVLITLNGASALWPFLTVAAIAGMASALTNPAGRALTPEIVPIELLPGAIALRSVANQIGIIVGPAVGGAIFQVEPVAVYIVAGALFLFAFATILGVKSVRAAAPAMALTWENLSAGISFIVRTRMLLGAISLDLVAVLFGDSIALAPVFARTILDVGPFGLGLLRAAPSVGALTAGLILARRPLKYRAGPTLLVVVGIFGAMMIVFGLSKSLPLSLAALAVAGFADMISMNIRSTTVLLVTPHELQGRVSAVEWVFISASNELGAFESGVVASLIGTVAAVVAGGCVMIGVAGSWGRLFPELSHMGRLEDLQPEPV